MDFPCYLRGHRGIYLGSNVHIWKGARIEAFETESGQATITIGDQTVCQPHVHIGSARSVTLGSNVLIASFVYISDHDHDYLDPSQSMVTSGRVLVSRVSIGDFVWLGERVVVTKGVTIGAHSIIGANSVVTHDIPDYSIAAGIPARVIKRYDHVKREWVKV